MKHLITQKMKDLEILLLRQQNKYQNLCIIINLLCKITKKSLVIFIFLVQCNYSSGLLVKGD